MKISDSVEYILKTNELTRSDDRTLLIEVWEAHGFYMSDTQKDKFKGLPSAETIRRIRQKIQESGKYPASETVKRHRKFKGMQVQQRIPNTKPEKVDQLINERSQESLFSLKNPFRQN